MSDPEQPSDDKKLPRDISPEMRRGMSRRSLIRDELGKASMDLVKQLPSLSPVLRTVLRESEAQRDERLVKNLWFLFMGREPKPDESGAGLEVLRNARTPDEKGDALVDIAWALTQTRDFDELKRPGNAIVRGLYRIALDRDPTDDEKTRAMEVLAEAQEPPARTAAIEGLFTALIRSGESVLRKEVPPPPAHRRRWF